MIISMDMQRMWSDAIAMAVDDSLIQAMHESCRRLCSNESFI